MLTIVRECGSEALTDAMAKGLADVLMPGDRVALHGDLGAGKTTFVRHLAAGMGISQGRVSSPTFVLINAYPVESGRFAGVTLVHADLYRLTSEDDLDATGLDHLLAGPNVFVVEWADRAPGLLGAVSASVRIEHTGPASRRMTIELPDAWASRPAAALLVEREPRVCDVTGGMVSPTSASYPFANERAKLADLGRWLSGGYSVSRDAETGDGPSEF